jgi:repressor LexA
MTEELTPKQQKILNFVRKAIQKTGYPPTRVEISKAFRYSSANAAEEHLRMLERKGAIELTPGASRGIRLTEGMGLPLIGRVAAGSPILAEEHIERRCEIDPALFEPRADYLLKVRGMSMRDAGIMDGDLLAVQKARDAKNGQIVVARLGDDVTVKRFRRTRTSIELIPENPDFKTIVVPFGDVDFALEGIAVGLIRNNMMM